MNDYKDPDDETELQSLLQELKEKKTIKDVYEFTKAVFPTWIIRFTDEFSHDYNYLNKNWNITCKENGGKRAQIMIVDFIGFTSNYTFLKSLCEIFTMTGFVVRADYEVILCSNCYRAIPYKEEHARMQEYAMPVPERWSNTCSKCEKRKPIDAPSNQKS
jgi:hypothetical protein